MMKTCWSTFLIHCVLSPTWTKYGNVEVDDIDGDELDCPSATHHDNIQLKHLCSRLRKDLKEILLFTANDCQVLVDADRDVLCQLLHRNSHEIELIQTACQRYIDEQVDFEEARSLLQLVQKDSRTAIDDHSTTNVDDSTTKRKRRK